MITRPANNALHLQTTPVITLAFAIILLVTGARADSLDSKDSVAELFEEPSVIDEVIVVERKNVSQLRAELAKADDRLFSLYNTLNTNDSLDMICKKETRIGSQIKHRVCKSSYHRQLESESGSDVLEGGGVSTSDRVPAGHYDKVRSNMATLMSKNPELVQVFYERAILRKRIAEQKREH